MCTLQVIIELPLLITYENLGHYRWYHSSFGLEHFQYCPINLIFQLELELVFSKIDIKLCKLCWFYYILSYCSDILFIMCFVNILPKNETGIARRFVDYRKIIITLIHSFLFCNFYCNLPLYNFLFHYVLIISFLILYMFHQTLLTL